MKKKGLAKKGKKRAASGNSSNSSSGNDKKPAKRAPHEVRGKGEGGRRAAKRGGRQQEWVGQMVDRWWIRGKGAG